MYVITCRCNKLLYLYTIIKTNKMTETTQNIETQQVNAFKVITDRARTISRFTYTNETATEKAWLVKTMKQHIEDFGRPTMLDESDAASVWGALSMAYSQLKSNEY